ncbi:MAG: hypothetical protein GXO27_03245 [Chlorobi bacterium]|nr:hypothetical protein [Chlorobiota bacterium]
MKQKEIVGTILKEETMEVLTDAGLPRTLVLHIIDPFPGFHGDVLPESASRPDNIFFVTKKTYSWEKIIRTANKVREHTPYKDIDASFATVMFGKTKYFTIRVHHIPTFNDIAAVQEAFARYGDFEFHKRDRKGEKTASIKLTKFFEVEDTGDGCYKDLKRDHMYYFELPAHVNWDEFKKITYEIKDSTGNRNYDVALATFFKNENVYDAVRVFKPGVTPEFLTSLKDEYARRIEEMEKMKL